MIAMPWTLLMLDTIPRQASKPAQQKTSATVASNLGSHKSLKHMKSSMLHRCGHALCAIKSQKVMTSALFINTIGPNQCNFATCSIDGHPYGNDEQYTVWWHMQEDHGLRSPLGCPKCDETFCSK